MVKASLLFPCLIILFLIASGTGFVDASDACTNCEFETDCDRLHCAGPRCVKDCIHGCCGCNCSPPSEIV
ncbi:hypothetical protein JHK82_016944 [Glycine max]|nr:hypothetical protein JHK82_016944 [Glycine max]